MASGITSGSLSGFAGGYSNPMGGANSLARSVDVSQYAAAVHMINVATDSMQSQFGRYMTIFDDVA